MLEEFADQAQGLRRRFQRPQLQMLPLVANPHVAGTHRLLDALCRALGRHGLRCLVVDAVPGAGGQDRALAQALARGAGLERWIEHVETHVAVLAADPAAWCAGADRALLARWSRALQQAAPDTDVVVFHAQAELLSRLFARHEVCPLVLCGDTPDSLTHAYAGIKTLSLQAGLRRQAVLLDLPRHEAQLPAAAVRLARCARDFLGAELHPLAWTHAMGASEQALAHQLSGLSIGLLREALEPPPPAPGHATMSTRPAAAPARVLH